MQEREPLVLDCNTGLVAPRPLAGPVLGACSEGRPLRHRDSRSSILAYPRLHDYETDDRAADIAYLQCCYCQNRRKQSGPEAVAMRHTETKNDGRAHNNGRDKDRNLEAQAEQCADKQSRHR